MQHALTEVSFQKEERRRERHDALPHIVIDGAAEGQQPCSSRQRLEFGESASCMGTLECAGHHAACPLHPP